MLLTNQFHLIEDYFLAVFADEGEKEKKKREKKVGWGVGLWIDGLRLTRLERSQGWSRVRPLDVPQLPWSSQ